MKKLIIFAITALTTISAWADSTTLKPDFNDKKGAWSLVKPDGKYEVSPQFSEITVIPDGFIVDKNGKKGFYNLHGKRIIKTDYEELTDTPNYYFLCKKNGKWGVVSKSGKELLKPKFDTMVLTEYNHLCVTLKGQASLINPDGGRIIMPGQYSDLKPLAPGLISAFSGTLCSVIDEGGKEFIESGLYDSFSPLSGKVIMGHHGNMMALIDFSTATPVQSRLYSNISAADGNGYFVKRGTKSGIIDNKFKELVPPDFDSFSPVSHPKFGSMYILNDSGLKGWADGKGTIVRPMFSDVRFDSLSYIMAKKDGAWLPYDIQGKCPYNLTIPAGRDLRIIGNVEKGDTIQDRLVDKDFNTIMECCPTTDYDYAVAFKFEPVGPLIIANSLGDIPDSQLLGPSGEVLIKEGNFTAPKYYPDDKMLVLLDYGPMREEDDDNFKYRMFNDAGHEILTIDALDFLSDKIPYDAKEILTRYLNDTNNFPEIADEPEDAIEVVVDESIPWAQIEKVWVNYNVYQNNRKGMRIHVKFRIYNCQYVDGNCVAWFYFSNGTALRDYDNNYHSYDGQVSVGTNICPSYESTIFNDLELFIPIDQLHLAAGQKHECMFKVGVFAGSTQLATSDPVYFQVTPSAKNKSANKKQSKRRKSR